MRDRGYAVEQCTLFVRPDLTVGAAAGPYCFEIALTPIDALEVVEALTNAALPYVDPECQRPRPVLVDMGPRASILVRPDLSILFRAGDGQFEVCLSPAAATNFTEVLMVRAAEVHYAAHPNDPRPVLEFDEDGKPSFKLRTPQ